MAVSIIINLSPIFLQTKLLYEKTNFLIKATITSVIIAILTTPVASVFAQEATVANNTEKTDSQPQAADTKVDTEDSNTANPDSQSSTEPPAPINPDAAPADDALSKDDQVKEPETPELCRYLV